jgi:hypothetical protein
MMHCALCCCCRCQLSFQFHVHVNEQEQQLSSWLWLPILGFFFSDSESSRMQNAKMRPRPRPHLYEPCKVAIHTAIIIINSPILSSNKGQCSSTTLAPGVSCSCFLNLAPTHRGCLFDFRCTTQLDNNGYICHIYVLCPSVL